MNERIILRTTHTISDQPIVLPQKNAEVVVSILEIEPGLELAPHQHPFARYGYILSGTLSVTNLETGMENTFTPVPSSLNLGVSGIPGKIRERSP